METIISAIMGELATRSLSFLIGRYLKTASSKEESSQRLQWMLQRVHLTVEEAEGRCITNQAMLQQLNILREVMYRGYYILDTFIQQAPEEEKDNDQGTNRSLSLSKFNPAKRFCFSAGSKYGTKRTEEMLESVEIAIANMSEFVIFLRNYPRMFRQPYSTYLFIEKCMFGRQMEMDRVTNFLLYEEPPVDGNFGVLPIVGPGKVGKTTLVEHVCCDERVRNHFSCIIFLSDNDFREEKQCTLRDQGRIKHQHDDSNEEKLLVIVELVGNVDESAWRRLLSAYQSSVSTSSKIIITSRSENITNFGTTQALSLNFLSREAYWYFFKALLFGSTDPEEQPMLASIALKIFDEYFDQEIYTPFTGPFIDLNNAANLLKSRVGAQNWRRILGCIRENRQQNERLSRKILSDFGMENDHIFLRRVTETTQYCVLHNHDRIRLDNEDTPKTTLVEIISGSVPPHGKFEVLVWKSHLPPYHNHIYSCEILDLGCEVTRNKQCEKRKILS
ncbi:putative disease resistance protein RGA3 [Phragmites australis]|uniref:putative disease resistance protein RGA3 n=1 Tax=Phragmites australis TaxID=29695 RepID=UPI002D7892DA|nr:putative disease resistance protein RGA3 [Phragmites australis]